jgi:hypothetical protein
MKNIFKPQLIKSMKPYPVSPGRRPLGLLLGSLLLAVCTPAWAQKFDVGSDGSLGDVVITENTTIDLPPDGKLHYKSLVVNAGVEVTFKANVRNTPVFILSQGDVVVDGAVRVNGGRGSNTDGGVPGPGGFGGGKPGFGTIAPGAGYGPGAGKGGEFSCCFGASAADGAHGSSGFNNSKTYGNTFLIPLIGGSGGGGSTGSPGFGGGGGGGAIQIASNTRIAINRGGSVEARGGEGRLSSAVSSGSGGAIRLVALRVEGAGLLDATAVSRGTDARGRIRVDTLEHDGLRFNFQGITSVGGNLFSLPTNIPRLDTIEVGGTGDIPGTVIPVGSPPQTIFLPFGSTPERTVKIQARDFAKVVPIRITLTPDTGSPVTVDTEVDNTVANPAVVTVPVTFPVNSKVTVHCWTR